MRLDQYLITNNYFKTRSKAKIAIIENLIKVNGKVINKPSFLIDVDNDKITIIKPEYQFVSRGGFKLLKALQVFEIDVKDKVALDIGASTGGFTDCLLQHKAKLVYAVDVGDNQLDDSLKNRNDVISYEHTNFRYIDKKIFINELPTVVVIDVSFISLKHIFVNLINLIDDAVIIALIKPQFEIGKIKKGIVKDFKSHLIVLKNVVNDAEKIGFYLENITFSPITGGSGNIEYLGLFGKNKNKKNAIDIKVIVEKAFQELRG